MSTQSNSTSLTEPRNEAEDIANLSLISVCVPARTTLRENWTLPECLIRSLIRAELTMRCLK